MKSKLFLVGITILATLSVATNIYLLNNKKTKVNNVDSSLTQKQAGYKEALLSFGKNEVVVSPQSVVINEGFESHNPLSITIDKKNYPDLFSPEDEFARLHFEEILAGKGQNIPLIRIARQIPNHGSLADSYFVLFDPAIGKVVDTGWNHLFGTVYIYSSCMSCALPLFEFTEYDQKQRKFVLTNNEHIKDFQNLLQQHKDVQKKETCRISGTDMTLAQAVKTAKDDDKCADMILGLNSNKPSDSFITIGQYRSILENIQKVINGENVKVFERI